MENTEIYEHSFMRALIWENTQPTKFYFILIFEIIFNACSVQNFLN